VGREHAHHGQAVRAHQLHELIDRVRRIDQQAFTRGPVADGIDEVHHLRRDQVVAGKVPPRQELTEVEAVVHDPQPTSGVQARTPASRHWRVLSGRLAPCDTSAGFALWEGLVEFPMLDLGLFGNRRFTAASNSTSGGTPPAAAYIPSNTSS